MTFRFPLYSSRLALVAKMIGAAVPFLNFFRPEPTWPVPLKQLRVQSKDTLGFATAELLGRRGFDLLPNYETHDLIHALLQYKTTTTGELELQAFMLGNRSASFEGKILLLLGLLVLPELCPLLTQAYRRGRTANERLDDWEFATLVDHPIITLRNRLGIE